MSQVRANPLLFSVLAHSLLLVLPLAAMKPHLPALPVTMTVSLMPASAEIAKAALATIKATAQPVPQAVTQPSIISTSKREMPDRVTTVPDRGPTPSSEVATTTTTATVATSSPSTTSQTATAVAAPSVVKATDSNALALYGQALSELFARQQRYPRLAEMRGWEGDVLLQLRIARKGALLDVQVSHSSGFDILDRSAMQLVQGSPLPPLPAALGQGGDDELKITVPIHYRLSRHAS